MFLLKDTTQRRQWGLNRQPLCLESSTLPLSHYAPYTAVEEFYLLRLFVVGMVDENLISPRESNWAQISLFVLFFTS